MNFKRRLLSIGHEIAHADARDASTVHTLTIVADTVSIDSGTLIDVSERGYLPGYTVGNTVAGAATGQAGGSYGGYAHPHSYVRG